jgi:hypothetical protein
MRHPVCKVSFPNYSLAGKLFIASILIACTPRAEVYVVCIRSQVA